MYFYLEHYFANFNVVPLGFLQVWFKRQALWNIPVIWLVGCEGHNQDLNFTGFLKLSTEHYHKVGPFYCKITPLNYTKAHSQTQGRNSKVRPKSFVQTNVLQKFQSQVCFHPPPALYWVISTP